MTREHRPSPSRRLFGTSAVPYSLPFSVQGSCELSEDYFLTDQVIINPASDLIRPFVRADGRVEALVLAGGNLAYLQRDPTATSGWTYTILSGNPTYGVPNGITDMAVGTDSSGNVTGIYVSQIKNTPVVGQLLFDASSSTWYATEGDTLPGELSQFHVQVDTTGKLYFYAWNASGIFYLYLPDPDGSGFLAVPISGPGVSDIADAWMLWNSDFDSNMPSAGGILMTDSQGNIKWYAQVHRTSFNTIPSDYGTGTLLWAGQPGNSYTIDPMYTYQDGTGNIIFTNTQDFTVGIGSFGAELGPENVAVWQTGGLYSFAMLFGDIVNVVTEYGDPIQGTVTPPIPLQPSVMAIFSAPADPTQGTLFVLLEDATLNVLAKDPTAGWSLIPVVQDGATLQELDGWRVQLSVTDANGASVVGTSVSVTADRPIGTWQASGNTRLAAQEPTTFTTDAHGRVTFATPAVELDTAQLTVQIVSDDDNDTTSQPVIVSPDADVHAFLAGTAPLNDLGTFTPTGLLAAKKADGTPLCPVLTNLPADNQTDAASAVISAMNQCVQAGQGVTPGPNDIKSFTLDLSGTVPTYSSSTQAASVEEMQSLSGWWDNAENDFDSFAHGVRHKATQIAKCTANWVKDEASDAYHWAVNLAVTVADDIIGVANYVITDMKTAIHAVTGFFQKLGAAIGDAISWIRHNIGDLIREAGQNAAQVEHWLTLVPAIVNNQLTHYGDLAQGFFAGLETTIDDKIDGLMPQLGGMTIGTLPPPPPGGKEVLDVVKFLHDVQHNWLLDKIESFFAGDKQVVSNTELQTALDQLAVALQDGLQFVEDIADLLWTGLKDLFANRSSYDATTCTQLFTILKSTVHNLLAFADAVVQTLIDLVKAAMDQLGTMLSHQFNEIPLVGGILKLFGIDPTMSVAHLVSLVLMYPATLGNRIKNGSGTPLFPAASEQMTAAQLDWAFGLQISAAIGQGIWGVADAVGDSDRTNNKEPSGVIGWIDIVSPIVLAILEWPGAPNADGTTAPPFANNIDGGGLVWATWLLGFVPPISGLCGQFADYKPSAVQVKEGGEDPEWPEIGQYFTMTSAIASTITGSIYNWGTDQTGNAKAAGILGNISNIIAPFATKDLAEATEYISELIKLFIDIAGNIGAAVAIGTA